MLVRQYAKEDIPAMIAIWNQVVEEGNAFPQNVPLDERSGEDFFAEQTCCGAALDGTAVVGMYILHPNNVGRCGHICNASYAVDADRRGNGIGGMLVRDSLERAREHGFRVMQFNAVAADNVPARRLYERLGFTQLGTIPGGFRRKDGRYIDICPYFIEL